jgi:hypothetical protein
MAPDRLKDHPLRQLASGISTEVSVESRNWSALTNEREL